MTLIILAQTCQQAVEEISLICKADHIDLIFGRRRRAARARGDVYAVWGFPPSPLAQKAVESVVSMYRNNPVRNRFFYTCYAGTHTSVIAASLQAGIEVDAHGIEGLRFFDRRTLGEVGVPVLIGIDPFGAEVYALGTGWLYRDLEWALCDVIELASAGSSTCMCSVRGFLDLPARIGGFLSRRCGFVSAGRRMVARALSRKLPEIREAVSHCLDLSSLWQHNEGRSTGEVVWVDGTQVRRSGGTS